MKTNQQIEAVIWRSSAQGIEFLIAKRTPERGGFWQPLTGGVEEGELLEETVKRELGEEFGITYPLAIYPLDFRFSYIMPDGHVIREEVFGVEVSENQEITLSDEHTEYRWCNRSQAEELLLWEDNREALRRVGIPNTQSKSYRRKLAAAVLLEHNNRYLIIQRGAQDSFPNLWELPGGGIEANEDILQAAKRELHEEAGITDITFGELISTTSYLAEHEDYISERTYSTYHAKLLSNQPVVLSGDHQAFAWISKEELGSYSFNRHGREALMKYFNIQ